MSIVLDPPAVSPSIEVADLCAALTRVVDAGPPLDDERLREDLRMLLPALARIEAATAERVREFETRELSKDDGFSSTISWVIKESNMSGGQAQALVQTGRRMAKLPRLAESMKAGKVTASHLRVTERATSGLPERLTREAIKTMSRLAEDHDPTSLGEIGQRIREHISPELTDEETRDLDQQQWMSASPYDGGTKIDAMLRGLNAEAFAAAMRRFDVLKPGDDRTAKERRADALGEMARVAAGAPAAGLAPVQVTVVCDLVTLQRAAAASLGQSVTFGGEIPAAEAEIIRGASGELTKTPIDWRTLIACVTTGETRRLVLGPGSEVLDLGRTHRFFSRTQRIAIRKGEMRCRVRGCRSPWVEYDHKISWFEGGKTDAGNGRPFCGFHNRLRLQGWDVEELDNGDVRMIRPADYDARRRRRRRPRLS